MTKHRKSEIPGSGTAQLPAPESLLPLRPTVFAMLLVLNREDMHGYGIMKRLNERRGTGGLLGPGTLYRTLKEMRDVGLVSHAEPPGPEDDSDERRSYYTLTPFGRQVVVAEAERIAQLMKEGELAEVLGAQK